MERDVEAERVALAWAAICRDWELREGTAMGRVRTPSEQAALVYVAQKGRVFDAVLAGEDRADPADGAAYQAAAHELREAIRLYVRVKDGVLHQRLNLEQERSGTADE